LADIAVSASTNKGACHLVERGVLQIGNIALQRKVVLASEKAGYKVPMPDGLLDNNIMDIKGVEGFSAGNIKNKFSSASRQGADTIVLYYPDESVFSIEFLKEGYKKYMNETNTPHNIKDYIISSRVNCTNTAKKRAAINRRSQDTVRQNELNPTDLPAKLQLISI
jgi:hypothetical protein